jgi:uncharacterized membrane protein (DUF485 family)
MATEPKAGETGIPWEMIDAKPEFHALLAAKARFIGAATVFFLVYYFALLGLVGWFPEIMKRPVLGRVNLAYVFALSQFVMAWVVAAWYVRKASAWDKAAADLLAK